MLYDGLLLYQYALYMRRWTQLKPALCLVMSMRIFSVRHLYNALHLCAYGLQLNPVLARFAKLSKAGIHFLHVNV